MELCGIQKTANTCIPKALYGLLLNFEKSRKIRKITVKLINSLYLLKIGYSKLNACLANSTKT